MKGIKSGAKELASNFKREFVYTEDNRLIWHYWPELFYEGWEQRDHISIHTPKYNSSTDFLYEDISHSGINVAFIVEYTQIFGFDEFTKKDMELLSNTLDGIIKDNGKLSNFISGDVEYQGASRFYYISPYWAYIDNERIRSYGERYLKFLPEYDQAFLKLYANCLTDVETAYVNVTKRIIDGQNGLIVENKMYCGKEISMYIHACYKKHSVEFIE